MSSLRVVCVAVLVGIGGVAAGLAGSGSSSGGSTATVRGAAIGARSSVVALDVQRENARPGTPGWEIGAVQGKRAGLAAYAGAVSVTAGARVPLVVSGPGAVRIRAFRIGWYDGVGARQVWAGTLQAHPQTGSPATWPARGWADTTGWPAGDYLLRLDAGPGAHAVSRYVPLTVRSASAAGKVLLLVAPLTWEVQNSPVAAKAASFDRPYTQGYGAGTFLTGDLAVVQQAERTGRPLAYATDYDVARQPALVTGATAVVTGNSQDWTTSLRTAFTRTLKSGGNLAFFGGGAGSRVVTLKSGAASAFAATSGPRALGVAAVPASGPTAKTTASVLKATGVRASCPVPGSVSPKVGHWTVAGANWWGYHGARVHAGQELGGLLGGGTDRADIAAAGSPKALEVLSSGDVSCGGTTAPQSAVYWVAPSGAGVFAAGTARWPCAAGGTCLTRTGKAAKIPAASRAFAETVIRNVVQAFATPRAGTAHPVRSSGGQYSALG